MAAKTRTKLKPTDQRKFTARAQGVFLLGMEADLAFYHCAEAAGVAESTVRRYMDKDADFRAAVMKARERHLEIAEKELRRRAIEGTDEIRTYRQGNETIVHTVKVYSDRLLEFYLRSIAPEKYGDRKSVNITGDVTVTKDVAMTLDGLSDQQRNVLRHVLIDATKDKVIEHVDEHDSEV